MRIFHHIVVFSVLNIAMSMSVFAQTFVSAGTVSGTWSSSGSPFLVQGSIIIPDGQTLTIDPGVNVIFQGSYQLFVQGRLLAEGTVGDSISFIAQDTTLGWRGIRFDNTPITNDSSKIIFCKILHGKNLNYLNNGNGGGLYINNFTKIKLSDCLFQFCKTTCSGCNGSNGNGAGIYSNSTLTISNSNFKNNDASGNGGAIYLGSGGLIQNSLVQNNSASNSGGIFCTNSIIDNSVIINNIAIEDGGGIFILGNGSIVKNSIISFNIGYRDGGGIHAANCLIENNFLEQNIAGPLNLLYGQGAGGAIYGSDVVIINNTIKNNLALSIELPGCPNICSSAKGGGIFIHNGIVKNNLLENNSSEVYGGAIYVGFSAEIVNNYFMANSAGYSGGAIGFSDIFDSTFISGNLINNNTAFMGGAIGLATNTSNIEFRNNTIVNNSATNGGAFYAPTNNSPVFKNCILYGNTATQNGNQIYLSDQASQPSFYNCNIQGGSSNFFTNGNFYTGTYSNNVDTNPLFINPTAGSGITFSSSTANWRLQSASPCVDAGQSILGLPLIDLDSSFRVQGSSVDIGAYEYLSTCSSTTTPTFGLIGPFCQNSIPANLPLISINGIYGTWNPSVISTANLGSLTYTFTPFVGQCANSTSITITTSSSSPDATINQVGPISACYGDTVLLSCDFNSAYSYQWYKNGMIINGATSSDYFPTSSGSYSVVVSQSNCQSTSSAISVVVHTLPSTPIIVSAGEIIACSGGTVTLTATSGYSSYTWNNGATGSSIIVSESGDYSVSVTSSVGCNGTSEPYIVNASFMQAPQLCLVGLDSLTNENRIIWEKPISQGIDSFYVYKETAVSNFYTKIGATDYNDLGLFIDVNSNPSVQAYRYKLSILDTCGSETNLSDFHKTIHLTINQGVGGAWNLIWNHYEGISFSSYNIYRGTDPSNISLLSTIQSNLNSYTDLTPPVGILYYQIEVVNPNDCDPTKNSGYGVSRSNVSNNGLAVVENMKLGKIFIYPNPTNSNLKYEISENFIGQKITIRDISGRIVFNDIIETSKGILNIQQLSKGTYHLIVEEYGIYEKIIKD